MRATTLLALTLAAAWSAGCSVSNEAAFTPVPGADGAYCRAYRSWKVVELDAGGAFDQPGPVALRKWWRAYIDAEETMLREAPAEIRHAVEVKVGHIESVLTPLVEKYDFDLERMLRDGSANEQTVLFGPPPPELDKAQATQYAYEEKTCGTAPTPPPANVVFRGGPDSEPYCRALGAFNAEIENISDSRFDPGVVRLVVAGERFAEVLDGLDAAAPAEIAVAVRSDTEWFRTRWAEVLAKYDYDIRRIYVGATPEDLAVFNRTHPDVLEHAARDTAYEEQLCSG